MLIVYTLILLVLPRKQHPYIELILRKYTTMVYSFFLQIMCINVARFRDIRYLLLLP